MAQASSTLALHDTLAGWIAARLSSRPELALGTRLAQSLRDAVLQGVIAPGQRLPATRALALRLGVARNTLVAVYAQLAAEGFVVAGQGSGTYACKVMPERVVARPNARPARAPAKSTGLSSSSPFAPGLSAPSLSARGLRYQAHPLHRFWSREPFCPGLFDADLFPHGLWNRLLAQPLRQADAALLGAGEPGGAPALRQAIAQHVRATRGVRCEAQQVIITDSTAQSLDLIARLLCDPGDRVWIENPCYWGASQTLSDLGLALHPIDVDADGVPVPPAAGRQAARVRLAYLTPSHQFPTGAVMPLARRLDWLAHARQHDMLLIEDDYDSEYRYTGMPFPSLQGLDSDVDAGGRVLYLGSFSKTMYPGIRVGFMVVPAALATVFGDASADFYRDGDQLVQHALARFMAEGHYAAHVRALRREFGARREALVQALWQHLPDGLDSPDRLRLLGGARGVHLTIGLPDAVDDQALALQCRSAGATVIPLSVYCVGTLRRGLVLSYAGSPVPQIAALVARIAPVIRRGLSQH
ncbi:PLP-dependent aminotransferase family protein [Ideonella sp. DXS29W]|uniref:PLP-dependent aminotransferase family protein n=1 Tax=Ideonella lacteola TaxID=2984193 RepID=A0ABU9BSR5_9BURK